MSSRANINEKKSRFCAVQFPRMKPELSEMKQIVIVFLALAAAASCFAAGKQLTGVYAPTPTPALPPAEAQKKFTVPDGFEVRLFASEPDVINPVAMTWDARGRLWVLELYEYPLGAPAGTKPRDRIKILEDTDNDGVADKVTIFADGLNLATGMVLGDGGVYVGQAPDLLFLQDTNHDDKADTRTVLLSGFGLDDRHELLNGFSWGPDGWLYLTHGVFTHSKVKIPEASAPGVEVTAAVARFQPRTKVFEVFADGTSNPWGVDFDAKGNAFVSACVIDHLFHMAPGGIYVRQGGTPANPYAYELLPSIVDHKHHMAAYCGVCIYQGNQFPEEYRGHVFMGNIHQNAVNHDRLTPNGSSFKASAERDFLTTTDGWFRPVSEQVGPDGALWIADWCDKYPCYQNAQADPEGVDRERGRIWRIVHAGTGGRKKIGSRPDTRMDLSKLTDQELVHLLEHPNIWQRRMAQRILSEREASPAFPAIADLVEHGRTLDTRLAALWTLYGISHRSPDSAASSTKWENLLRKLLDAPEPALCAWAVRFTGEDNKAGNKNRTGDADTLAKLVRLASHPDPSVRLAVATACRQIVSSSLTVDTEVETEIPVGRILSALITASSDAKDALLPFMIWMAGEPVFAIRPDGALNWLAENGGAAMPLSGILVRKAMRRICDTQETAKLDLAVDFLQRVGRSEPGMALAALDGLIEGQKAKPQKPTADTEQLFATLRSAGNRQLEERAQELGTLWGNAAAIQATLGAINDPNLSIDQRTKAIAAAKTLKNAVAREALLELLHRNEPESLVLEAIRALGQVGGESVADDLLKAWSALSPGARSAAAEVLVSRRPWASALLSSIETKVIAPMELPITALRSLADSKDDFIRQRATQTIGRIRPANADKQKLIEARKAFILSGGAPDLLAGHELAKKTCLVCHKFYGEGAEVGPDLTGVGRSSLDALLANVIDPNLVVGKGYENVEVETRDGRTVSGRLVENTDTRLKLVSSGPKEDVVAKSDVASMRVSELSVMPEGLEQMPETDFRNLILYILHPPQENSPKKP
jgi:putative membrane-bound dehydrogenase-like protein